MKQYISAVKRRMKVLKWGHAQVAEAAGCSRHNCWRILTGRITPSYEMAERIAKAVGLKIRLEKQDAR